MKLNPDELFRDLVKLKEMTSSLLEAVRPYVKDSEDQGEEDDMEEGMDDEMDEEESINDVEPEEKEEEPFKPGPKNPRLALIIASMKKKK